MNLTLILAALAATSVLLIMFALVGRRGADPGTGAGTARSSAGVCAASIELVTLPPSSEH